METHQIIKESKECYLALGIGNWFSWYIVYEYGEWVVFTIYGTYQDTFSSLNKAIKSLTLPNY